MKNPIHHRYFLTRMYVAVSTLITVLSVVFEPASLNSQAAWSAKLPDILFYPAIIVCLLAMLDVFVNDILPSKYRFTHAYNYRHIIYMCLALISLSLSAGLLLTFGGSLLVGRLWLDGFVASAVAILDIFARHRGK